ncbi:1-aminocyclopropane-1-carboxylate synthase-like [Iris pallida]|uniref:1-aminocyclopropane-1-carboxylate synthase n=1 Tax=Iris pallida TaxID=29817 RepID=A0AAX6EV18_IRIPA|nr:1-aminocyclopropane-1-carboxylate synthase-like [Iris pallida]
MAMARTRPTLMDGRLTRAILSIHQQILKELFKWVLQKTRHLCHDLMEEWLKNNQEASICTAEGASEFKNIANFQDYHGLPAFRVAMAKFMEKVRGGSVRFDPDRIIMSGGATGAQELIAFCLADPGDAFLIPTPYYPGSDRDFSWRTGVQLLPVHCDSSNNFQITAAALESAYEKAQRENFRVRGVLITNPTNPLGTSMDRETLQTVVSFINGKQIHLVCDEIFAGTNFSQPRFISVSEILDDDLDCNRELVHIIYSLSKVLGLPGFRVGVVYSYNDDVVSCGRKMSSFGLVSSQTQHLLASMLSDDSFTTKFLADSAQRLSQRHHVFTSGLAQVNIGCLKSNAGLFCWMDLRPLLKEATVEAELDLWRVIVHEVRLNVSPGSSFHCSEPGWFRVCYANIDHDTMQVALRRIHKFVEKVNGGVSVSPKKKKKKSWDAQLRLSLPRKFEDLTTKTPRYMTPRCLMSPRSPLVRAAT